MRRMTLFWLILAAVCGGVLFHTSQQVTDGRTRLNVLSDDVRKENETIRVLQAEWSYLNQPDRLEKLSKQYLDLAPLKGRQFAKLQDIPDRPVAAAEAAPAPEAENPGSEAAAAAATPEKQPEKQIAVTSAPEKKPPVKAVAAKPTVVKFRKPAPPPATAKAAPPVTASEGAQHRSFSDMIKGLGVH